MLTSPIQWPVLAIGVSGMLLTTYSVLRAARTRDARRLQRMAKIASNLALGSFAVLLAIDIAAIYVIGRTKIVGFYFALVVIAWLAFVIAPLGLRTQRMRRAHRWPVDWDGIGPGKDEQ